MTIRNKLYTGLMACVLILFIGQNANAEETSGGLLQELRKQVVQALPKEFVQEIKKQFVEEIKKELAAELKKELFQGTRPQAVPAVLTSVSQSLSSKSESDTMSMIAAIGKQMLKSGEPLEIKTPSRAVPNEISQEERPLRAGVVAVITNTTNPVKSLTVQQAKRLFTGEYTNWNQVGGPDLPVKVVTYLNNTLEIEDLMKASVAPDAAQLRYASLLVPSVDRIKGAIGFITTRNVEQVEFINRHEALQKLAIRANEQSPAVSPSVGAIHNGSYPMVVDQHGKPVSPVTVEQAAARVSLNYR